MKSLFINIKIYTLLFFAMLIQGCAGSAYKWDQARQIREGMSHQELAAIMGSPYQVRVNEDGQQLWQWVYVDLYGLSGGTRTLNVAVKDGKVFKAPAIPDSFK